MRTEALWQAMFASGACHTGGYPTQVAAGVDIDWDRVDRLKMTSAPAGAGR